MKELEDRHIESLESEKDDSYSNDDLYNISSYGADLSFRELISMYDEDELLKPELQRKYVWEKPEASRFIDSILLGLPVPSIFLANTQNEKKLIIDGYQRIMTVFDFVKGIWSNDKKIFRLSNTEKINERWRGKAYSELTDTEQRKIRSTTIHAIIFEQKSPKEDDTSLFQVFERINTSGRTLMPQEIRNCVYQGSFNTLLFKLNKNKDWRILFGANEEDTRMRDLEFILRFFATDTDYVKTKAKGKIQLKKYLNEFMGAENSQKHEVIQERDMKFSDVMKFIHDNIGVTAFYNIQKDDPTKIRKRFYPTIFDAISVAVAIGLREKGNLLNNVDLESRRINLLQDDNFRKYSTEGTTEIEHMHGRINLALEYLFELSYE